MEISVFRSSKMNLARNGDVGFCNFSKNLNSKICNLKKNIYISKGCNIWASKYDVLLSRVSASAQNEAAVISEKASKITKSKIVDGVKLYVGLPLDTISNCNTINRPRAIAAGLKALKLLGVDGVELPVWWGIAEKEAMGKYEWTNYLAIVEMIENLGLKLHISLCFHASEECKIPLPQWIRQIGEKEPDIYFKDRSGECYKGCLSLAVDELPVLGGKTPVEAYREFCESFKSEFSPFFGSTITGISIGLGPEGELRYPSHHRPTKSKTLHGAGEFQCYDKNMLRNLKQHAEMYGNELWGLSGPHDAPGYNQSPLSSGFFSENGGSWEIPYGDFFLSWYSNQLISHGDRILSLAASTFKDSPITLSGKVPLIHSWYQTRSHPSELTAGLYNTAHKDGYKNIIDIFSRNSCRMLLPGMDLLDKYQSVESRSSPESLFAQIMSSCRKHGVNVCGENSMLSCGSRSFEHIKKKLLDENVVVDLFTYQRIGAHFFSPEHFPSFTQFVRGLKAPIRRLDEATVDEVVDESNLRMSKTYDVCI